MMLFPPLGKIGWKLKDGRQQHVVYLDAGKNSLCFTLDGVPYLRGGVNYPHYLQDHREFCDLPTEYLDEAWCLVDRLTEICNASQQPR